MSVPDNKKVCATEIEVSIARVVEYYTHGSRGMNETGPIKQNAIIISTFPVSDATFGFRNLSTDQPHSGAVIAYSPPLMTNTRPSTTGLRPNWRRCGSSTAVRKPIEALVAMIDKDVTITPGMLMILRNEPEGDRKYFIYNSFCGQCPRSWDAYLHRWHSSPGCDAAG